MSWRIRNCIESPHFKGYRSVAPAETPPGEYARAMTLAAANLHAAVTSGEVLASTGDGALAAQRICEQIRDSALRSPPSDWKPAPSSGKPGHDR